ncbi:MAG: hypothetical protein V7731_01820 [Amphritea sp.]
MPFDVKQFDRATFKAREAFASFPALKGFFDEGEEPGFTVRGLSGTEIALAKQDAQRGRLVTETLLQMNSANEKEKVSAMLQEMGINDDDPAEVAQLLSHLEYGIIEPKLTRAQIVKLVEFYGVDMLVIGRKILELSGQGAVAEVKP